MNCKQSHFKKNRCLVFLFLIIAFVFVKIPFSSVATNGNTIYNCMTADYWNFAKDIVNGKQLYVDLLDHKGIYMYFPYIFAYLLGKGNLGIVAFLEAVIYGLTISTVGYLSYKKTNNKKKSILFSFVFAIVYFFITIRCPLINVEGLIAPFYFLFYIWIVYQQKIDKKYFFLIGMILGVFTTIKYSSLLYFAYLFLFATISFFLNKKKWIEYAKCVAFGVLGFLVTVVPFAIYLVATNTLQSYISLMKEASFANANAIISYTRISILLFVWSIFLYKKKKETFEIVLSLSTLFLSLIGMQWLPHYFAFLFTICFPILLVNVDKKKKAVSSFVIFFVFSILVVDCISENTILPEKNYENTTKGISERYGMTNNNTLYLTEDLGFGAYSKEPFKDVYQWIPSRMIFVDSFYNYLLNLNRNRIQSKEYEYLVIGNYVELIEKDDLVPNEKMWNELFEDVQNNYDLVEMVYDEIALWKAKPKQKNAYSSN